MILPLVGFLGMAADLFLFKPANDARGIAGHNRVGRHIFSHHRSGSDDCAFADSDSGQNASIETDPNIPFDANWPRGYFRRGNAEWPGGQQFQLFAPGLRIQGQAVRVHKHDVPRDKRIITYADFVIANDAGAMDEGIIAQFDPSFRADIEHRAQIGRSAAPVPDSSRQSAAIKMEAERGFNIRGAIHVNIRGNGSPMPIPRQCAFAVHGTFPIIRAGLPSTRARGGISLVTSDPASMNAPAPIRTPFKITAFGPIQTSSSMMIRFRKTSGRARPLPSGEQATASAILAAGA